jgi:hypothetical protein
MILVLRKCMEITFNAYSEMRLVSLFVSLIACEFNENPNSPHHEGEELYFVVGKVVMRFVFRGPVVFEEIDIFHPRIRMRLTQAYFDSRGFAR